MEKEYFDEMKAGAKQGSVRPKRERRRKRKPLALLLAGVGSVGIGVHLFFGTRDLTMLFAVTGLIVLGVILFVLDEKV